MKQTVIAFLTFVAFCAVGIQAQEKELESVKDKELRKHLMDNIDIFGKVDLSAIYIFVPGVEEMEANILTRDFSRDEFFMQNIDREEFEWKVVLRNFNGSFGNKDEDGKEL